MNGDDGTRAAGPPDETGGSPLVSGAIHESAFAEAESAERPRIVRLPAAVLFISCSALLAVAVYLKPDPHGMGTHQQLGLQPCGMLIMTGYPCPTCGMTTAFAYAVRGQIVSAIHAQVSGFLLALATIAVAAGSLFALVKGRWPRVLWQFLTPYRLMLALLVLTLGGWFIKIAAGWIDGSIPIVVSARRW